MKIIKFISTIILMAFLMPIILFAQSKITVVAAANLKTALDSIVSIYKIENAGTDIDVIYGASGNLFEQISNDAPFDIFLSADMDYPMKLKEKNFAISEVDIYAIGQLVLWSKKVNPAINQMNTLLDAGIVKISIGNPATAPYGKKAVESMRYYKVYDRVQSKLVYGENITQAGQFVSSGAADIGIVALSMALSPAMQKAGGKYYIIPEKSHNPLEQGGVLLKHAKGNRAAKSFFDFISSAKAIAIFTYYGYSQKTK
jgi:molybdate transport system substrate-binding protein